MKTACILLRNENERLTGLGFSTVLDEFLRHGFPVAELRMLSDYDDLPLKTALTELKKQSPLIVVLAKKALLAAVKKALSETLRPNDSVQDVSGRGIFSTENETVILTSYDDADASAAYVKNTCVPYLQNKFGEAYDRVVLRAVGANETLVKELISRSVKQSDGKLRFLYSQNYDESVIEILYDDRASKRLVDGTVGTFVEQLSDSLYAVDDTRLEERLVELLKLRGKKISIAESFTGGGVAKRISSVSGASNVYFEGLNTYNEESKIKRLGVRSYTLNMSGAVSDKTAYEMAAGLMDGGDCDIAVSTTGIAGPNSDRTGAPVGLAFIGIGTKEKVYVYRYRFDGTRKEICEKAINYALFLAYKHLKKE